jgi:hypothetical protein
MAMFPSLELQTFNDGIFAKPDKKKPRRTGGLYRGFWFLFGGTSDEREPITVLPCMHAING